jgi:uncharacterized protein (UPF0332 family)
MSEARVPIDFCWKNYLTLAQALAKTTNDEAYLRSAISRAYYAAFCSARNFMINNDGKQMPSRNDLRNMDMSAHVYIMLYFKEGRVRNKKFKKNDTRRTIGKDLDTMRVDRENVDYDNYICDLMSLKWKAEESLIRSKRVVEHTERGGF